MYKKMIAGLTLSLLLVGCNPTKQEFGTFAGAGIGALWGSQIGSGTGQLAAVAIGTLVGSQIGNSMGRYMDEADYIRTQQALEANPTGSTVTWNNPVSGNDYSVTPTHTYSGPSGPCRDYTTEIDIEGHAEIINGTACRQSDGTWHPVN